MMPIKFAELYPEFEKQMLLTFTKVKQLDKK